MATNASTWFYSEPERNAYLIEERVNHTFWSNRITDLHLDCTNAEPPFRMVGEWQGLPVEIEWEPKKYLTLTTQPVDLANQLLIGIKEILGFNPVVSYVDPGGKMRAEWYASEASERIREIQGNPNFRQIKQYK